jgi:hypothetical protein
MSQPVPPQPDFGRSKGPTSHSTHRTAKQRGPTPAIDPLGTPSPFPIDPADLRWEDATSALLALSVDDLSRGLDPSPILLAFAGDEPLAVVGLRPFEPGQIGQALLEVLSLLVPLGGDRLAFCAAGRVWSSDDPIPAVCSDGDLRQRVFIVALADARGGPCTLTTSLHPFEGTGDDVCLDPPLFSDDPVCTGPTAAMLVGALDQREELRELTRDNELLAQLGRVLLLGHYVALAPDPAAQLTAASTR